ncbi:hypothetical protein GGI42DRAFT_18346 [Trichoderma sp. SZMC 28013]
MTSAAAPGVEAARRRLGLLNKIPTEDRDRLRRGPLAGYRAETTVLDCIARERLRSAVSERGDTGSLSEGIGGRRKRLGLWGLSCVCLLVGRIFFNLGACGRMPGAAIRCSRQVCDTVTRHPSIHPTLQYALISSILFTLFFFLGLEEGCKAAA